MKKLLILLINVLCLSSALAQESAVQCELHEMGGSIPGFVAHGFITLLVFMLLMKWSSQFKAGTKPTGLMSTDREKECKQAA